MVDVAALQIQVDSQPVLTAAQNLAALSSAARRTEAVLEDVGSKKPFSSFSAADAKKSFESVIGVVNSFSGELKEAATDFAGFGTSVNDIGTNLGSFGDSFTKLGDGLTKITQAGGTKSLGKVVGAIKQIETASTAAEGPVTKIADAMGRLRDASSGISTSGNSFKTSLSNLVRPADSAAGKLERAATAAAALSSTIKRIGNQGGGNAKIQNVGKVASEAGEAFRSLSGPLGTVVGELGGFQTQIATIVKGIGESATGINGVKTQFDTISNSIALLGDKNRLDAIIAVATALIGYGKAAGRAVGPLKNLVVSSRELRDATTGMAGRYTRFNTALDGLVKSGEPAATKVKELGEVASVTLGKFEKLEETVRELRVEVGRLQAQTGRRGGLRKIANEAEAAGNSIARAGRQSKVAGNFLRQFATGLGLVGGGFAAALGARAFVNTLADFEFQAAKTAAVAIKLGGTYREVAEQTENLVRQSRDLGATTRFTAVEAAEAQFFLARAGFEVNEILEATPATLNLAAAGYIDLGRAADIASNVLKQFSLETFQLEEVTNTLVFTANSANTSVEQMANALSYAGPFAASLGISVDEASAAIGALGNAGIQGSLAGTNLRGVLVSLISPSKTAGQALDKLGARIGGTRDSFNVATQGLEQVLENLSAAGELTDELAVEFAQIFNRRNVSGALALTKNVQDLQDILAGIAESADPAREVAEAVDDTLTGSFLRARSAAAELSLSLGDRGVGSALRNLVENVAGGLRVLAGGESSLKSLNETTLKSAKVIKALGAGIAGAIGAGTLVSVFGALSGVVSGIRAVGVALGIATAAANSATVSFTALSLSNPLFALGGLALAVAAYTTDLFGLAEANYDAADATDALTEAQERASQATKDRADQEARAIAAVGGFTRVGRLIDVEADEKAIAAEIGALQRGIELLKTEAQASGEGFTLSLLKGLSSEEAEATLDALTAKIRKTGGEQAAIEFGQITDEFLELARAAESSVPTTTADQIAESFSRASDEGRSLLTVLRELAFESGEGLTPRGVSFKRQGRGLGDDASPENVPTSSRVSTDLNPFFASLEEPIADFGRVRQELTATLNTRLTELVPEPSPEIQQKFTEALVANFDLNEARQRILNDEEGLGLKRDIQQAVNELAEIEVRIREKKEERRNAGIRSGGLSFDDPLIAEKQQAVNRVVGIRFELESRANFENTVEEAVSGFTEQLAEDRVFDTLGSELAAGVLAPLEQALGSAETSLRKFLADQEARVRKARLGSELGGQVAFFNKDTLAESEQRAEAEATLQGKVGIELEIAKERIRLQKELNKLVTDFVEKGLSEEEAKAKAVLSVEVEANLEERLRTGLIRERAIAVEKEQKVADNIIGRATQRLALDEAQAVLRRKILGLTEEDSRAARVEAQVRRELLKTNIQDAAVRAKATAELTDLFNRIEQSREVGLFIKIEEDTVEEIQKTRDKILDLKAATEELSAAEKARQLIERQGIEVTQERVAELANLIAQLRDAQADLRTQERGAFIEGLRVENEELEAQLSSIGRLTAAREAEIIAKKEGGDFTDKEILAIKREIEIRNKLEAQLEERTKRKARERELERKINDAIQSAQQDLAAGLTDVAYGAQSASEAFAGFIEQLGRAILQAQIFKALGPLFKEGSFLADAVEAGVQVPGSPVGEIAETSRSTSPDTSDFPTAPIYTSLEVDTTEAVEGLGRFQSELEKVAAPFPVKVPLDTTIAKQEIAELAEGVVDLPAPEFEVGTSLQAQLDVLGSGLTLPAEVEAPLPATQEIARTIAAEVPPPLPETQDVVRVLVGELPPPPTVYQKVIRVLDDGTGAAAAAGATAVPATAAPATSAPATSAATGSAETARLSQSLTLPEFEPLTIPADFDVDTSNFELRGVAPSSPAVAPLGPPLFPPGGNAPLLSAINPPSPLEATRLAEIAASVPNVQPLPEEFSFPEIPPSGPAPFTPTLPAQLDDGVGGLLPSSDPVLAARVALNDRAELDLAKQLEQLELPELELPELELPELELPEVDLPVKPVLPGGALDKDEYLNDLFESSGGSLGVESQVEGATEILPSVGGEITGSLGEAAGGAADAAAAGASLTTAGATAGASLTTAGATAGASLTTSGVTAGTSMTTAGVTAGTSMTTAGVTAGTSLTTAGTSVATSITTAATSAAATLQAANAVEGATGGATGGAAGLLNYKGNVIEDGIISKGNEYYSGGVPSLDELPKTGGIPATFRGSDGSLNTLREGGSQEAILPLGRDGSGRLGVRMVGMDPSNSQTSNTTNSTVNNNVTNVTVSGGGGSDNSAGLTERQMGRKMKKMGRGGRR